MTGAERDEWIRRYAEGPALIRKALAAVPSEAMKWRPGEGKWSVHEVVCHCADSEVNAYARIRFLIAQDHPTIQGYDENRWARDLGYHDHPLDLALATVDAVRANTVPLLRRLPEEAWARDGMHTESGHYTADRWLRIYAEHLEIHARQIERNLTAWNARS